jgi:HTH-type transcriptional regulator, glycine betaine synthesis regulator
MDAKTPITAAPTERPGLSPLEREVIDYFVNLFRIFTMPKSVGEVYGLLFASPRPLTMEELVLRLRMSKGAVSQGLKVLRSYGAIRSSYVPGDRRDHYSIELGMRRVAAGFLKEQLTPQVESAVSRLDRMEDRLRETECENHELLQQRIESLRTWQNRGTRLLPMLLKMIGS